MGTIMGIFLAWGCLGYLAAILYRQLDQKLMTLAQAATPSMRDVSTQGEGYLAELDEVPWRDIFNRNQQSLEWFDVHGNLLAKRGNIKFVPRAKLGGPDHGRSAGAGVSRYLYLRMNPTPAARL